MKNGGFLRSFDRDLAQVHLPPVPSPLGVCTELDSEVFDNHKNHWMVCEHPGRTKYVKILEIQMFSEVFMIVKAKVSPGKLLNTNLGQFSMFHVQMMRCIEIKVSQIDRYASDAAQYVGHFILLYFAIRGPKYSTLCTSVGHHSLTIEFFLLNVFI